MESVQNFALLLAALNRTVWSTGSRQSHLHAVRRTVNSPDLGIPRSVWRFGIFGQKWVKIMICDWGSKLYVFLSHKKIGAFCMKFVPLISSKTMGLPGLNKSYKKFCAHHACFLGTFLGSSAKSSLPKQGFWQAGFPAQITIFQQISDRVGKVQLFNNRRPAACCMLLLVWCSQEGWHHRRLISNLSSLEID